MNLTLVTSIIGLIGGLLVAAFTYWATKRRERDAEWRKEKLAYYKLYIESLSGIIEGEEIPDGQRLYAKATNNLLLFAPESVIDALNTFRIETAISNQNRSQESHDDLLAKLLLAIREDVGVQPADDPSTFKPILWASGARKNSG